MKNYAFLPWLVALLFAVSCAASPQVQPASPGDSRARASQALGRMDSALGDPPASGARSGNVPAPSGGNVPATPGAQPAWTTAPYDSALPRNAWFAAVGHGPDRNRAEQQAFVELANTVFGQRVQAEERTLEAYNEALASGRLTFTQNSSLESTSSRRTEQGTLVGAEIHDVWDGGRGEVYARAVLEKSSARVLYGDMLADMLAARDRLLAGLTGRSARDRNTFEGVSTYRMAAVIADASEIYGRVLVQAGGTVPVSLRSGKEYRDEADSISREIRLDVRVSGDRNDVVKNAFTQAISTAGYQIGAGGNYRLNVSVVVAPADEYNRPGANTVFVRYTVGASLVDTRNNSTLFSYNFENREGHTSIPGAETRAYQVIVRRTGGQDMNQQGFARALQDYVASRDAN